MDNKQIAHFKSIVRFLGEVLGKNYEVAFHVISKDGFYIEEIVNGHISGRNKNAPLTDLALDFIKNETYKKQDFVTNYKGVSKTNQELVGSTYFIKEGETLTGMLCINADTSVYKDIAQKVMSLGNFSVDLKHVFEEKYTASHPDIVENFSESIEEILYSIVDPNLLRKDIILRQEQRIEIVEELEKKSVFQLKGAVAEVANLLHVSEPSIYRYLKVIEKKKDLRN